MAHEGVVEELARLAQRPAGPDRVAAYRDLDDRLGAANATLIDRADGMLAVLDGPECPRRDNLCEEKAATGAS